MGYWQNHKGQTGYRLMNLIEQYCGFNIAEDMIMSHNHLDLYKETFATYEWSRNQTDDSPFFTFHGKHKVAWQKEQFIKMPFVDFPYLQVTWICQEVRKSLSFMDALEILHIAKHYDQIGWNTINCTIIKNKILNAVTGSFHPNQFKQLPEEYKTFILTEGWKWFGFGAIAEIVPEEILNVGLKPYSIEPKL